MLIPLLVLILLFHLLVCLLRTDLLHPLKNLIPALLLLLPPLLLILQRLQRETKTNTKTKTNSKTKLETKTKLAS